MNFPQKLYRKKGLKNKTEKKYIYKQSLQGYNCLSKHYKVTKTVDTSNSGLNPGHDFSELSQNYLLLFLGNFFLSKQGEKHLIVEEKCLLA